MTQYQVGYLHAPDMVGIVAGWRLHHIRDAVQARPASTVWSTRARRNVPELKTALKCTGQGLLGRLWQGKIPCQTEHGCSFTSSLTNSSQV